MEAPQPISATIRLEAHQCEISLAQIVKSLSDPLLRHIPIISGLGRSQPRPRTNDFRDAVMAGLTAAPPEDETERADIRQALKTDLERQLQLSAERARHATGEALALIQVLATMTQCNLDALSDTHLNMREYARIVVKARIQKMLDDDVAAGRLVVSDIDGKAMVGLDSLVGWAVFRKITVEQDSLPGCQPLVQEAYSRLRRRLSNTALAAQDATTELPDAVLRVSPDARTRLRQTDAQDIPGELPNISIGRLAVKAAWQIECEEKRRATAKEVMARLQLWADNGSEPDVLRASAKEKRGVIWLTGKYEEKLYSLEACQRTLEVWNKSRH